MYLAAHPQTSKCLTALVFLTKEYEHFHLTSREKNPPTSLYVCSLTLHWKLVQHPTKPMEGGYTVFQGSKAHIIHELREGPGRERGVRKVSGMHDVILHLVWSQSCQALWRIAGGGRFSVRKRDWQ